MKIEEMEKILALFEKDDYICHACGRNIREGQPQRAHVLSQGKYARKKFGKEVIDSIWNWRSVCSLECNNKLALNWATRPIEAENHANEVRRLEDGSKSS